MEEFIPDHTYIIRDLELLKVIADPLRNQVFEALVLQPLTVKQVADQLGLATSKLYYHINLLEKHSLIRVVDTRVVANMIEKYYRATACNLDVDPALLSFSTDEGKDTINTLLTSTIDTTREDILRSLQAHYLDLEQGAEQHPRRVVVTRQVSRIPEERVHAFQERLVALLEEFKAADVASDDLQTYAFTVAFYPSFYFHRTDEQQGTLG